MSADGQQEPSMEDILASIRKILSEDEADPAKPAPAPAPAPPKAAAPPPPPPPPPVEREPTPVFAAEPDEPAESIFDDEPEAEPVYDPNLNAEPEPLQLTGEMYAQPEQSYAPEQPMYAPQGYSQQPYGQHLVADPVADASSASIAGLAQAVARERALSLGNQGITIEQLVREICTPILKHWLDTNLPYMVERIVKQEIERVVTRSERL